MVNMLYIYRSFTELGSSVEAPMFRAFNGILSPSESENPKFHMWNMVDFLYCDGGSFLGVFVYIHPEVLVHVFDTRNCYCFFKLQLREKY